MSLDWLLQKTEQEQVSSGGESQTPGMRAKSEKRRINGPKTKGTYFTSLKEQKRQNTTTHKWEIWKLTQVLSSTIQQLLERDTRFWVLRHLGTLQTSMKTALLL